MKYQATLLLSFVQIELACYFGVNISLSEASAKMMQNSVCDVNVNEDTYFKTESITFLSVLFSELQNKMWTTV